MFNSTLQRINRIQGTGLEVIDVRANVVVDCLCDSFMRLCFYCSPTGHTARTLSMRPWQLKPATAPALLGPERQAARLTNGSSITAVR